MGGVFWRGGSRKVVRPTTTAWLRMEDVYIFCNVIKKIYWKKVTKIEKGGPSSPCKLQMELHHHVKTHWFVFVDIQIPQLLMGGIDQWGVGCNNSFFLVWTALKPMNLWSAQDQWHKSTRVGSTLTTLAKVQMPFLWAQCQLIDKRS